jgi:hypothetical protein
VGWASAHRNTLESRTDAIPHSLTIMGKEWFLRSIRSVLSKRAQAVFS